MNEKIEALAGIIFAGLVVSALEAASAAPQSPEKSSEILTSGFPQLAAFARRAAAEFYEFYAVPE